ncbi:MAG TPA: diacylglycerol kinase [Candidatus Acidoferrales bacterium]|nr:diacylglycerol kinase [Candidatus Acidoferrales bacterium]
MPFSDRGNVWRSLARATRCSLAGLRAALPERAFRQELVVLVLVAPLALYLGKNGLERALLIGSWLLVLIVEMINSAIETVLDRVGLEPNELSGRAKDMAAAAVFLTIVLAGLVWMLVLAG